MKNKSKIIEDKDPDWMYKSILNGAFSGRSKTDKDVIGNNDGSEYPQ